jgi:hypothetical protein
MAGRMGRKQEAPRRGAWADRAAPTRERSTISHLGNRQGAIAQERQPLRSGTRPVMAQATRPQEGPDLTAETGRTERTRCERRKSASSVRLLGIFPAGRIASNDPRHAGV